MELLVFEVDGERCALPAPTVREVLRAVWVSPLPDAPAVIPGVVDVRGAVLPVLDTRLRFGRPSRALGPDDHLLVVQAGERLVALQVDRALDLLSVESGALDGLPHVAVGGRSVAGAVTLPGGLVLIHDPAAFLSEAEAAALDDALRERAGRGGAA